MAQLSQQARPLLAIVLVVLLLVLVCAASVIVGSGGGLGAGVGGGSPDAGLPGGGGSSGTAGGEGGGEGVTSYSSDRTLADEASSLLSSYEGREGCVLREAGFLDLFGNAWTCTVQGPGWVDVCLVSGTGTGEGRSGSDVRVVHMEADEWERAYGQAVG